MIKTYWLRILLCGVVAAILGFVATQFIPPQYEARYNILVAPYAPPMPSSQDVVSPSVQEMMNASAPRNTITQQEMLHSDGVLQKASIDVLKQHPNAEEELMSPGLRNKITVSALKDSDLVQLDVRMSSPELARDMASAIYNEFKDTNNLQSNDGANRAIAYLTDQVDQVRKHLNELEDQTARMKEARGMADPTSQQTALVSEVKDLDTALESARSDLVGAQGRADEIKRQMAGVPATIPGTSAESEDPRFAHLEQQLLDAQSARDRDLTKYTPENDIIKADDALIASLQAKLKDTKKYDKSSSTTQPNPLMLNLKQDYASAVAAIKGAADRVNQLEQAVAKKQTQLNKTPALIAALNVQESQRQVLERVYELYTQKLKMLQYGTQLNRGQTYTMTSDPIVIPKPVSPEPNLNVSLGFFLGLAVGFLWSVGTEAKRNPVRTLGQLNRLSLQPCYRVIPELRSPMRGLTRAPAENYDSLLVNYMRSEKKGYRLGVLGVTKNAGASTTAMNLAISAARAGSTVLFVELDSSNSALNKLTANGEDSQGAASRITVYSASLSETVGSGPAGLSGELAKVAVGKDLVIYDFAPVKTSGDAFLVASHLDEMVLLVRQNVTRSVDFLQAQQSLIDTGCPVVTVTLSRVKDQTDDVFALEQQADVRSIVARE